MDPDLEARVEKLEEAVHDLTEIVATLTLKMFSAESPCGKQFTDLNGDDATCARPVGHKGSCHGTATT